MSELEIVLVVLSPALTYIGFIAGALWEDRQVRKCNDRAAQEARQTSVESRLFTLETVALQRVQANEDE